MEEKEFEFYGRIQRFGATLKITIPKTVSDASTWKEDDYLKLKGVRIEKNDSEKKEDE